MDKKWSLIFGSLAVALTMALFLLLNFETKEVYPFPPDSGFVIGNSHEGTDRNFSKSISEIDKDGVLHFKYCLTDANPEPFAATYIHKVDSSRDQLLNFSDFDKIEIHIKATKAKRIPIFLTLDYKGFTSNAALSSLPLVQVIDYHGEGTYELSKKDFEIPSWWLRYHGKTKESFPNIDFSRVNYIVINSCQTIGPKIEDEIQVSSIFFTHDNKPYYIYYGIAMSLLLITALMMYLLPKRKKILVPYQVQQLKNDGTDQKIDRIVNYLATHYTNPELSSEDVQRELGISTREIGTLIKEHFDASFKVYLNTIRLSEVRRLLQETDLPISDIAYKTGYNNIPHFNRVFKKEFNITPKEFREQGS